MYRISIDAMGGDYAPYQIVKGGLMAAEELGVKVLLVGIPDEITKTLEQLKQERFSVDGDKHLSDGTVEIVPASSVIGMGEKNPAKAARAQKDASVVVANRIVAEGKADAVIAAGNTGAATATSLFELKRIKGFERPCIASLLPTHNEKMLLIDAGSNIDSTAQQMYQTAILGDIMARSILASKIGDAAPRVGLLNVGEEPGKGTELYKQCYELLEKSDLNFVGNVEGKTIIDDICDIAICDGFTGNIHLKALEGGMKMISEKFKHEMKSSPLGMIAGLLLKASGAIARIKAQFNPSSFGGALLGGLNHVSLISHGSSDAEAIMNASRHACVLLDADVVGKLKARFQ